MPTSLLPVPRLRPGLPRAAEDLLRAGISHHWNATIDDGNGTCTHQHACLHLHLTRDICHVSAVWTGDRRGRLRLGEARVRLPAGGERTVPIAEALDVASTSPVTAHLTRSHGREHTILRLFCDRAHWITAHSTPSATRFQSHASAEHAWRHLQSELDELAAQGWHQRP